MAVTEEIQPLERKIIRQVEYYFGDFNLPKDTYLQSQVKENEGGWVNMETMFKFKRLADLSTDAKVIIAALKKSDSGLLEVSDEGEEQKLRRNPAQALPENNEETKKLNDAKTAYAKGYNKESTTMDELLEYYAEHEPAVVNIQMRNYFLKEDRSKHFKGSVFLVFRTEEACKAFIEAESKEYKGVQLIRKFKKDYFAEKSAEYEAKKKKKKKGGEKGEEKGEEKAVEKAEEEKEVNRMPKGAVIKMTGLGGEVTREDIKEKLSTDFEVNIDRETGDIAFITYQKGEPEAKIRFKVENYGKTLMEKLEKAEKIVIKEQEVTASLLEGEEEEQFLADSLRDLRNNRSKNKNHKRKGGFQDGHGKRFKRN